MSIIPISQSASAMLALFTLLLLTVSLGELSSSSLQTTMATFAQTPSSSSLADEIIDETATSVQDSSADDNVLEDSNEFGDDGAGSHRTG